MNTIRQPLKRQRGAHPHILTYTDRGHKEDRFYLIRGRGGLKTCKLNKISESIFITITVFSRIKALLHCVYE
jgi:hypothetical protein